ncbi:MFS transporter [Paenibacillus sp. B01]|uniref:MFS transporter n=1 Tax=Paenibacillus sp. B01 TaxID=2660554 RepID=UPI001E2E97D9|nr:MFS transporter [Paenibacillus sp. B01]
MSTFIQEWREQLGGYSRNIRLFFVFNLLWNIGLGMYSLIYNLYVKALGHAPTMVGDIVGATALAAALILIPAGLANDRFGAKRMIGIGAAAVIAVLAARAFAAGSGQLTALAFAAGMAQAIVSATILPFMADNSSPRERVHLFSFNMALVMAANVAGNLGGGLISDALRAIGGWSELASLRATLLVGVAIAAAGLVPILKFGAPAGAAGRLPPPRARRSQASASASGCIARRMRRSRPLRCSACCPRWRAAWSCPI